MNTFYLVIIFIFKKQMPLNVMHSPFDGLDVCTIKAEFFSTHSSNFSQMTYVNDLKWN